MGRLPRAALLLQTSGQIFCRCAVRLHPFGVILGHIADPDIPPGQQHPGNMAEQSGFSRSVGPGQPYLFPSHDTQADIPSQLTVPGGQDRQVQFQHRFARRQCHRRIKASQNGLFHIG